MPVSGGGSIDCVVVVGGGSDLGAGSRVVGSTLEMGSPRGWTRTFGGWGGCWKWVYGVGL